MRVTLLKAAGALATTAAMTLALDAGGCGNADPNLCDPPEMNAPGCSGGQTTQPPQDTSGARPGGPCDPARQYQVTINGTSYTCVTNSSAGGNGKSPTWVPS